MTDDAGYPPVPGGRKSTRVLPRQRSSTGQGYPGTGYPSTRRYQLIQAVIVNNSVNGVFTGTSFYSN
eukprot:1951846-Rhodomonas_salina.1